MIVLIAGSAIHPAREEHVTLLRGLAAGADLVVAADGGGALCQEAGVVPDYVVGDLDSLGEDAAASIRDAGGEFLIVPAEKDVTDLDVALSHARALGATRLVLTGVLGLRLDHTLVSIGSILVSADLEPVVIEPDVVAWVLAAGHRDSLELDEQGATVSLIACPGRAVVTCEGFRYPLDRHELEPLSSLGVSNVITRPKATVTVSRGTLVVVIPSAV